MEMHFLHLAKNAGTSILNENQFKNWGHSTIDKLPAGVVFCIWRHPVSRIVSAYAYARMTKTFHHDANRPEDAAHGKHPDYDTCNRLSLNQVVVLASFQAIPGLGRLMTACRINLSHPVFQKAHGYAFSRSRCVNFIGSFEHLSESMGTLNAVTGKRILLSVHDNKSESSNSPEIGWIAKLVHRIVFWRDYDIHRLVNESAGKLWRQENANNAYR